jgi:hypothetical protein
MTGDRKQRPPGNPGRQFDISIYFHPYLVIEDALLVTANP